MTTHLPDLLHDADGDDTRADDAITENILSLGSFDSVQSNVTKSLQHHINFFKENSLKYIKVKSHKNSFTGKTLIIPR